MSPTSTYKMSKSAKTWLALNKARIPAERFSLVKKCLIIADLGAAQVVKNPRRDSKAE